MFAYNLSLRADERDIFEFFSTAGRVVDVKLISDRNTRKSKGFAYIEMETVVSRVGGWPGLALWRFFVLQPATAMRCVSI